MNGLDGSCSSGLLGSLSGHGTWSGTTQTIHTCGAWASVSLLGYL
jgi:hypothetical protein